MLKHLSFIPLQVKEALSSKNCPRSELCMNKKLFHIKAIIKNFWHAV